MLYTIGEMAKLMNIPASTLRYYNQEGLLPFVERSAGGMRVFKDSDYEWLCIIECLKKTGMQLKDIRTFIHMAMQGDETIEARLTMIRRQRAAVEKRMAELAETLEMLDFKCWYYETALEAGTTDVPRNKTADELPEQFRAVRTRLRNKK